MSHPLGNTKLDAMQTIRKAFCCTAEGHRVVSVSNYDKMEYIYDSNCIVTSIEYSLACVVVDEITFVYDDNGNIVSAENSSGDALLNLNEVSPNNTQVTKNRETRVILATSQDELLHKVVDELRIMNIHLSTLTDNDITKKDLDTRDDL